ncbi:hypothetical protein [Brevundimonas sp.]|uniref:hypothetical protein n=1 Tax=Brevundimonas sp. TaxID=1871086 RepID=UPI001995A1B6|nr:hypothetical protein [Brevundimonas sp.]MBD3838022.1 hypothetical protein [Brevundimonas sp.]
MERPIYQISDLGQAIMRHKGVQIRTHSIFRLRAALRRSGLTRALWEGIADPNGPCEIVGLKVIEDPLIPLDVAVMVSAEMDAAGFHKVTAAIALSPGAARIAGEFLERRARRAVTAIERAERAGKTIWLNPCGRAGNALGGWQ